MKLSTVFAAAGAALLVSSLPAVAGVEANVPVEELAQYEKVYSLEIPAQSWYYWDLVPYAVDNHLSAQPFRRVAYYLELRRPGEEAQWVWVSMDAFTKDAAKIGIPTLLSQAVFQQKVTNLRIWSNVEGVVPGERAEGNIEFWPDTYEGACALNLGGDGGIFDFDDRITTNWRYGSFQVHDFLNRRTIFSYNHWSDCGNNPAVPVDLGIGNAPGEHPDWTFAENAEEYEVRHLEVWTMPAVSDAPPPVPLSARIAASRMQILVSFEARLAEGQSLARAFTLDDGTVVRKAELIGADRRTVRLTLAAPAAPGARLVVAGLHASPAGTRMPEAVTLALADATPAHVKEAVGELMDGYQLVYDLAIPARGDFNARGAKMYDLDDTAFFAGSYDRVGYYLELVPPNLVTQYVWVSFAPHTTVAGQLGVPLASLNYYFQQYVENMDVKSNVDGVTNGTGFPQGNVEMWPTGYDYPNTIGIVNAAEDVCDWGDERRNDGDYGSFQVHNAGEKQVVFALNNWGGDGRTLDIGIGTCNWWDNVKDWTFTANAGNFASRRLLVFVRATSQGAAPSAQPVTFRRATADVGLAKICCTFDTEPTVEQAAQANFTCPGATIGRAEVSSLDARDVILTLEGPLAADAEASVSFRDPVTGTATARSFRTPPAARPDVLAQIDESVGYMLVNQVEIPKTADWVYWGPDYAVDQSRFGGLAFDRIAYCLELVGTDGVSQWAWTSMDAFTGDLARVGVPCEWRGIFWQQYVTNLHVRVGSTGVAPDVAAGDFARGNIEFWPGNYGADNQLGIPGADGGKLDFGDVTVENSHYAGHGSMQVHATDQGKTVWAFSGFNGGASLGIGNAPAGEPDWTFAQNGSAFTFRRLSVFVRLLTGAVNPAAFMLQPQGCRVRVDSPAVTLAAFATDAKGYQWYCDGVPVPGATASWCEVEPTAMGTYRYQVAAIWADGTTALSEAATVEVFGRGTHLFIR